MCNVERGCVEMSIVWDDIIDDGGSETLAQNQGSDGGRHINAERPRNQKKSLHQHFLVALDSTPIMLTSRERDTLKLIMKGLTVPQAASELGISSRTAEYYVRSLRYKFKASSKKVLLSIASEHKVLDQL